MNYKQTLQYLYTQLPMYQRIGVSAFKKDLKNIKSLMAHFGNAQDAYPTIHVAGTNGKGTVSHMIAAMFQAKGLKVGLYTSPHYKDFRERIKINGEYISKSYVKKFCQTIQNDLPDLKASFFEITVAMAFTYFKESDVDIAIIETGLGGRLDSTNILKPSLSVITNISLDHQSMLGNTLKKIAGEKAGIIKKEIPVVVGEHQEATDKVFIKKAAQQKAELFFAEEIVKGSIRFVNDDNPFLRLNAMTALAAIKVWNKYYAKQKVSREVQGKALEQFSSLTNYLGRWTLLDEVPNILVDSAHNIAALEKIFASRIVQNKSLHIVVGFVKDKPLENVLPLFPKHARYYFCNANMPRSLAAKDLQKIGEAYGLKGKSYKSVRIALSAAKRRADTEDLIIVCGSIFIVSEVL